MHLLFLVLNLLSLATPAEQYPRVIHLHVALCDNVNQGIVPVPAKLGNGLDAKNNLYWGALYGAKTRFKASADWKLVAHIDSPENKDVLERLVFKHSEEYVFLVADAYKGAEIHDCIAQFLKRSNGQEEEQVRTATESFMAGGASHLVVFAGHNGLMEQLPAIDMIEQAGKETMILACASEHYFAPYLLRAGAESLLQTTGFMAPEAYTLEAAFEAWVQEKDEKEIKEAAAQAYNKYQKCGINGARRLFTTAG